MSKSRSAGWAPDSPSPAQLAEFFRQISSGRITRSRLQEFLHRSGSGNSDWFTFTTTSLSLRDLWRNNSDLFYQSAVGFPTPWWWNERFAYGPGSVRGVTLRTSAVPGSFNKPWDNQLVLLSDGEFVPSVRDVVDGMLQFYRQTGRMLFPDYSVRCRENVGDVPVMVGLFDTTGLYIASIDGSRDNVGLAVIRESGY